MRTPTFTFKLSELIREADNALNAENLLAQHFVPGLRPAYCAYVQSEPRKCVLGQCMDNDVLDSIHRARMGHLRIDQLASSGFVDFEDDYCQMAALALQDLHDMWLVHQGTQPYEGSEYVDEFPQVSNIIHANKMTAEQGFRELLRYLKERTAQLKH